MNEWIGDSHKISFRGSKIETEQKYLHTSRQTARSTATDTHTNTQTERDRDNRDRQIERVTDTVTPTKTYRKRHSEQLAHTHIQSHSEMNREKESLLEIYKQLSYFGIEYITQSLDWSGERCWKKLRSAERLHCLERGTRIWKYVGAWSFVICRSAERWKKRPRSAECQSKNGPERGALETPGRAPWDTTTTYCFYESSESWTETLLHLIEYLGSLRTDYIFTMDFWQIYFLKMLFLFESVIRKIQFLEGAASYCLLQKFNIA